jgi:Uma2 family endonuclease
MDIASTRAADDRDIKSALYARYGVQEFWPIDANERVNLDTHRLDQ